MIECFPDAAELPADETSGFSSDSEEAEDANGDGVVEQRGRCRRGFAGSTLVLGPLPADLNESLELLEVADDLFEAGDLPLAKFLRAAAAASAARPVEERPLWCGSLSSSVDRVLPLTLEAALLGGGGMVATSLNWEPRCGTWAWPRTSQSW